MFRGTTSTRDRSLILVKENSEQASFIQTLLTSIPKKKKKKKKEKKKQKQKQKKLKSKFRFMKITE